MNLDPKDLELVNRYMTPQSQSQTEPENILPASIDVDRYFYSLPNDMKYEIRKYAISQNKLGFDPKFIRFLLNKIIKSPVYTFEDHTDWIRSVAFSPDGQYILTGSDDHTAKLYRVSDKSLVHTFKDHTERIRSVAFSPDGQYILTGSDDETAKLYKVSDVIGATDPQGLQGVADKSLYTFKGHTDWICSVAFSPDGQYILTGSGDNTATLYRVSDKSLVHTFKNHTDWIFSVAFSPDGQYILTGSADKTVKLYRVSDVTDPQGLQSVTDKSLHTFKDHTSRIYSVAFSPDGQYILTGSDDNTANLYRVSDTNSIYSVELIHTFKDHTSTICSVAFSPDGQYILTGSNDMTAKLYRISDKSLIHTFKEYADWIRSVAFSPDGQYILTGSTNHKAKLWDISVLTRLDNLTWPQYELLEKIQDAVINKKRLQPTPEEMVVFNDLDNDLKDALKLYIKKIEIPIPDYYFDLNQLI